jgi:hypothetical protein
MKIYNEIKDIPKCTCCDPPELQIEIDNLAIYGTRALLDLINSIDKVIKKLRKSSIMGPKSRAEIERLNRSIKGYLATRKMFMKEVKKRQ